MPKRARRHEPRPIHAAAAKRGLASQDLVLSAAIQLTEAHGFEALTIASVARALGVRAPSLYKHVATLEALQDQVAHHATLHLVEALKRGAEEKTGRAALVGIMHAFRTFARAHPGLYVATVRTPSLENKERTAAREEMLLLIRNSIRNLNIPEERVLHVARSLRAAVHGFISLEQAGGFGRPASVEQSFDELVGVLCDGLEI